MKHLIRLGILFTFIIFSAVAASAQTEKSSDYTIDQYFNLLTSKQLPILDKYKNRGSIVKEVDYQNRYILLAQDEWKGWGEMVLFDKKGGGHLVVVTQYDCTQKYPSYPYFYRSRCAGDIKFLELSGKTLVEAKDVAPDVKKLMLYGFYEKKTKQFADSDDKLIYELPRERKDVLIKLAGEQVYSLVWNGEKFEGDYVK
ncbi:MAG: hypothetical protein ABI686_11755 [Acidobacteriota bacterium]